MLACLAVLSSTHCDSSLCLNFVICCCSNHEATFCTKHYGFRNELLAKYGKAGKVRAKEALAACAYKDPYKGSSVRMLDTTAGRQRGPRAQDAVPLVLFYYAPSGVCARAGPPQPALCVGLPVSCRACIRT